MLKVEQIKELFENDAMVKLLGIELIKAEPGYAETQLKLTSQHLNSAKMTHGAVLFAIADVTMAVASNMYGIIAVAFQVSINFLKASSEGNTICAVAREDNLTKKTGVYRIEITNEHDELIAVAQGTVFRIGNKPATNELGDKSEKISKG